jgi:hypothetical protein
MVGTFGREELTCLRRLRLLRLSGFRPVGRYSLPPQTIRGPAGRGRYWRRFRFCRDRRATRLSEFTSTAIETGFERNEHDEEHAVARPVSDSGVFR